MKIYHKWARAFTNYTKFKDSQDEVLKASFESKDFFVKVLRINFA